MTDSGREGSRLDWLDGLRGLAALQVVLLHYVFAFFPRVGMGQSPDLLGPGWLGGLAGTLAAFFYSGASAVYLFFIISGVVLTHAFSARPFGLLSMVTRRIIRLGLPMAAAVLLAGGLFALWPDAHQAAADESGSAWLRAVGPKQATLATLVHQIVFEGLLAGYRGWSLLPDWATRGIGLMALEDGVDAPLWTLHLELCGSLLVMLLVAVRGSMSREIHRTSCLVLGFALALSPLVLFVLGHAMAGGPPGTSRSPVKRPGRAVAGAGLLAIGILLCTADVFAPVALLQSWLLAPPLGLPGDALTLQKMIGAASIFGGIAAMPILRRWIGRKLPRWLGKISFSLYLVHFPLEFTCVAAALTWLEKHPPYDFAGSPALEIGVSLAGIAGSLAIAVLFERWVDRPSVLLSRLVGAAGAQMVRPSRLAIEAG